MRIPRPLFAALVVLAFAAGVWGARAAGVWRERTRHLPAPVVPAPAAAPTPGGLPM